MRRATRLLVDSAAPSAATYKVALGCPGWASTVVVKVLATTDGSGDLTLKAIEDNPDDTGTEIDIPSAAIDAYGNSATAEQRYLVLGAKAAISGTSFDGVVAPVTRHTQLSYTVTDNVTNMKIWLEYIGE